MSKPSQLAGAVTDPLFSLVSSARCALVAWTPHETSVARAAGKTDKVRPRAGIVVLPVLVLFVDQPTWSQQHFPDHHPGMSMSADQTHRRRAP